MVFFLVGLFWNFMPLLTISRGRRREEKINKKATNEKYFSSYVPPIAQATLKYKDQSEITTIINANNSREIEFLNKMNLKIFMLPHIVFLRSHLSNFLYGTHKTFQSVLLFVAFSPLRFTSVSSCLLARSTRLLIERKRRELPRRSSRRNKKKI